MLNLAKNYILQMKPEMKQNKLKDVFIRDNMVPFEIFFVVNKEKFDSTNRLFWNQVLTVLRNDGLEVSVSDEHTWKRSEKKSGWSVFY